NHKRTHIHFLSLSLSLSVTNNHTHIRTYILNQPQEFTPLPYITHTHTHTLQLQYFSKAFAKAIFFFKLNNILTVKVYYKYKYIQNTWLPTIASNFLTSNYEHYINCKQQFVVYLNRYK